MTCWRIDLQRKMPQYLQGNLSSDQILSLEGHLAECEHCRARLAAVQEGNHIAAGMKAVKAPENTWKSIEARIRSGEKKEQPVEEQRLLKGFVTVAAAVLALFVLFLLRQALPQQFGGPRHFNRQAFREVPLNRFDANAEPHVTTEGYVSDVQVDEEDGDLMFKLVDNLSRPNHFVICEIIPNVKLRRPPAGSRIRVYGVSRYDGQPEHRWYEVHPVLNIEPAD
jgi:anti-sigma factor RsiW